MGALAGFRYRDIVTRLKQLDLEFHRQAAGSHQIWFNPALNRYTASPNHPRDIPEGTLRHPQAGRHRRRDFPAEEVTPARGEVS